MHNTAERRQMILQVLCERRYELAENLAIEFDVTSRTIYNDIDVLSYSYPIITVQGKGGGIHIMDGFRLGMKYLTDTQCEFLERLLDSQEGKDKEVLHSIIKTFRKPDIKGKK